ncbi:MAG: alpha/beta hydrolase [Acidobacteriota bacterium]
MHSRTPYLLLAVLLLVSLPLAAAPQTGWTRIDLPSGSYLWRYLPPGLDISHKMPAVLFLHGSGGIPDKYRAFVSGAADRAGLVAILPKSSTDLGWGNAADERIVAESLAAVRAELPIDPRRVSIGGHSAGGAWAYLLAYTTKSGYSAVFSMAARFYQIDALADPSYKVPIRLYYGTLDPNYTGGSYEALKGQWGRLGVPWEDEIQPGYGHNNLPTLSMANGFLFLASKTHPTGIDGPGSDVCVPGLNVLCLGGGRFRVEVAWKDFQGNTGQGSVVPGASDTSGLFWFFAPDNWELLVKVLDGCTLNGHHWVFSSATTTVQYTLKVTDTRTGQVATWTNPLGGSPPAVTDTKALDGCN